MAESFHDPEALLREAGWLHGLTRRLALDPHAAEDLAQDTWVAALGARKGPRGKARPWLRGIARHLLTRRLRKPGPRIEAAPAASEALASAEASPDELMARAELQQRVLAAVNALEPGHRAVVLLHHHEGAPLEEVARRLGVPASTVRSRLQRAHARLREALDRDYHERGAWLALVPLGTSELPPTLPLEVLGMGTSLKTALASAVVVTVGVVVWRGIESNTARVQAVAPAEDVVQLESSPVNGADDSHRATGRDSLDREAVVGSAAVDASPVDSDPGTSDEETVNTERVLDDLRTAIERSINERMNPSALMDAALMLLENEVSDRAVPEPSPDGRIEFPVEDVPDGIEAHLAVSPPSRNPRFDQILTLKMRLTDFEAPYMVDGTPRLDPRASLTVWLDHEGEPLHVGFLTDLEVDAREARRLGLLDSLTFTRSAYYSVDLQDPTKATFKTGGTAEGEHFGNRDVPIVLEGRPLSHADVRRFGRRLSELYAGVREAR